MNVNSNNWEVRFDSKFGKDKKRRRKWTMEIKTKIKRKWIKIREEDELE